MDVDPIDQVARSSGSLSQTLKKQVVDKALAQEQRIQELEAQLKLEASNKKDLEESANMMAHQFRDIVLPFLSEVTRAQGGLTEAEQENMRRQFAMPKNRGLMQAMFTPMVKASRAAVAVKGVSSSVMNPELNNPATTRLSELPKEMQIKLQMYHMLKTRQQAAHQATGAQALPLMQPPQSIQPDKYAHLAPHVRQAQIAYERQQQQQQHMPQQQSLYPPVTGTPATGLHNPVQVQASAHSVGSSAAAGVGAGAGAGARAKDTSSSSSSSSNLPPFLQSLRRELNGREFKPEDADERNWKLNRVRARDQYM